MEREEQKNFTKLKNNLKLFLFFVKIVNLNLDKKENMWYTDIRK